MHGALSPADLRCSFLIDRSKSKYTYQFHFLKTCFQIHLLSSPLIVSTTLMPVYLFPCDLIPCFPALRISSIKISCSTVCYSWTSTAPCLQLTFTALFKFIVLSVLLHLTDPHICQPVFKYICYPAVGYSPAGHHISV